MGNFVTVIETVNRLNLELMTLELHSTEAETVQGVRVSVTAIAGVKVNARLDGEVTLSGPEKGVEKLNKRMILLAAQHFLGEDIEKVRTSLKQTLEGHQRQILGTLTVEQIYKDRAAFSSKVREHVHEDLERMGFEIVSYSIKELSDQNGYMEALGATQTAMVKREAAEGQAKNQSEAKIKVSQSEAVSSIESAKAMRQAQVEANTQRQAEAESQQLLDLKQSEFNQRVGEARERAEAAAKIERAKQQQEVMRQTVQQKVIEMEVQTRITEQEMLRLVAEIEGQAKARLMGQQQDAKGILIKAEAEATRIRLIAQAEADAIRLKGEAEAANLRLQGEAYQTYGDAAIAQLVIQKLPEMAAAVSAPLAKTERMVFVSTGDGSDGNVGGPAMFTKSVANVLTSLPQTIEGLTGFDLREALERLKTAKHDGHAAKRDGRASSLPSRAVLASNLPVVAAVDAADEATL